MTSLTAFLLSLSLTCLRNGTFASEPRKQSDRSMQKTETIALFLSVSVKISVISSGHFWQSHFHKVTVTGWHLLSGGTRDLVGRWRGALMSESGLEVHWKLISIWKSIRQWWQRCPYSARLWGQRSTLVFPSSDRSSSRHHKDTRNICGT